MTEILTGHQITLADTIAHDTEFRHWNTVIAESKMPNWSKVELEGRTWEVASRPYEQLIDIDLPDVRALAFAIVRQKIAAELRSRIVKV